MYLCQGSEMKIYFGKLGILDYEETWYLYQCSKYMKYREVDVYDLWPSQEVDMYDLWPSLACIPDLYIEWKEAILM